MKYIASIFLALTLAAGTGASLAVAAGATGTTVTFTPDTLDWAAGTGLSKGSSMAVLDGDPTKPGASTIRVKMPDGYTNQPHFHSQTEYITVMQGTVLFGTGDVVNKANAKAFSAGSFIMVPAGVHHWSIAQGETIEQVSGEGPLNNLPIKVGSM